MKTLFRLRFKQLGAHTHVRVFAGKLPSSLGKCGDLCFRNSEWLDFLDDDVRMEVLPEGVPSPLEARDE